jgi:PAS domain S-box-containing protein
MYIFKGFPILETMPFGIIIRSIDKDCLYHNLDKISLGALTSQSFVDNISSVTETFPYEKVMRIMVNDRLFSVMKQKLLNKEGNDQGEIIFVLDVMEYEDINAKLNATSELSDEFNAILESSYDGIYIADKNGYTVYVNEAYEKLTGTTRSELLNRHIHDLTTEGYFSHNITEAVLDKKETITDVIRSQKSGKKILVTGNPVFHKDGSLVRVLVNLRDITDLDYLKKQLEKTRALSDKYRLEISRLRIKDGEIIGNSKKMRNAIELALRVAQVDSTILISGESGVGKELVAELVHNNSLRRDKPFIKINCGAIPDNLLESELFGYEGGAFTGSKKEGKPGLFELAEEGTLLLDEVGEMNFNLQVKLLRVLQESELRRVGGTKNIRVNVRILAVTNKDLEAMVKEKLFRDDLYYRLNVVPIYVPSLRERREDIAPLANYFLEQFNHKYKYNMKISLAAIECLTSYNWPGNVRELENTIERLVVTTQKPMIEAADLPEYVKGSCSGADEGVNVGHIIPMRQAVESVEKELLRLAMSTYKSKEKAAQALGVDRTTVLRKMVKYGIENY